MTVTVAALEATKPKLTAHLDGAGYWQNHYHSTEYPRFRIVETGPRGRSANVAEYRKVFYVDNVACADLEAVALRLSHPAGTPFCGSCAKPARLTTGAEIYMSRPDLADMPIWTCDGCGGRVGCHRGTTTPLGTPANTELRNARVMLHTQRFDPIWKTADKTGGYHPEDEKARWRIRRAARSRLYAFLADKLSIDVESCHIGMFDLETCRKAWTALFKVTYPEVRAWAKKNLRDAA